MPKDKWTTANIPPQTGRLAVVTGATSGIGYEAALALARAGAQVVLAARNEEKAQRAMASIRRAHPSARLEFHPLDTARLASVREFGTRWQNEGQQLDILLLNAGIAAVPKREETEDGFERQFATNYLGHAALTWLLMPALRAGKSARVLTVSSIAQRGKGFGEHRGEGGGSFEELVGLDVGDVQRGGDVVAGELDGCRVVPGQFGDQPEPARGELTLRRPDLLDLGEQSPPVLPLPEPQRGRIDPTRGTNGVKAGAGIHAASLL